MIEEFELNNETKTMDFDCEVEIEVLTKGVPSILENYVALGQDDVESVDAKLTVQDEDDFVSLIATDAIAASTSLVLKIPDTCKRYLVAYAQLVYHDIADADFADVELAQDLIHSVDASGYYRRRKEGKTESIPMTLLDSKYNGCETYVKNLSESFPVSAGEYLIFTLYAGAGADLAADDLIRAYVLLLPLGEGNNVRVSCSDVDIDVYLYPGEFITLELGKATTFASEGLTRVRYRL